MRRDSKVNRFLLYGALFTTPILGFVSTKPNLAQNSKVLSESQNIEKTVDKEYLRELYSEGAISEREAEKLIKNLSPDIKNEINSSINNNSTRKNTSSSVKSTNIKLQIDERDALIRLKLINAEKILNYKIIKSNLGWEILVQFPQGNEIEDFNIEKNTKKLDIRMSKFNEKTYLIKIIDSKNYLSKKPKINDKKEIVIDFELLANKSLNNRNFTFPFLNRFRKRNNVYNNKNEAVAPPLGDIASGSVVLENRGFIKLDGPSVSLTLNNASAKDALMRLSRLGGYGFVLANSSSKQTSSSNKSEENNNGPYITLSFSEEDYSIAFNSILLASGLQAKLNDNLIIVGQNVLGKSFGPKLSKVYRLNQSSASAAADYLAALGASISKVDTISGTSSNSGNSTKKSGGSYKYIDSYSATTGPLIGLTGTTDSRLQTITLVGSSELILIAEKYLKQLDLRQRQVALSIKILNIELSDTDSLSNDAAFRSGSTFIVSEKGKLFTAFGNFIPPKLSKPSPAEVRQYNQDTTIVEGIKDEMNTVQNTLTTSLIPNPGWQYTANELYNFLTAQITSSKTKVLANPTLILSESTERIDGGAEVVGDMSTGQATIGRPFANESFITIGKNVITDYKTSTSEEANKTTCEAEFSNAGLTFGARVNKIDDNGFVTFSLSPKLTSVSEVVNIPNCGPISILSVKRLDTGTLRVKDSQTLILTGVISNEEVETITKTPLLGDIPIFGRLFRSTGGNNRKSELIILVTPKIIDDSYPDKLNKNGIGISSEDQYSKEIIQESLW